MPRAPRGRFEPLDHFVLGHLSMFGLFSAVARRRAHGLAIVVRWKIAVHASHIARMNVVRRSHERGAAIPVLFGFVGAIADAVVVLIGSELSDDISHALILLEYFRLSRSSHIYFHQSTDLKPALSATVCV